MRERIQKIIAGRGMCSRRCAEEWILSGRVTCNGNVCALGDSADPDLDVLLVDGKPIPFKSSHTYIMLNKPRGYVTTLSDEKGRKNVAQLVTDCGCRVYPVGRLDMDSEGLLILTNDGDFTNKLTHPSHEVNKVYRVIVTGYTDRAVERLQQPMELDGYRIRKPNVTVIYQNDGKAELLVTIHEGRNRQVRRMCANAGMNVLKLTRIAEGSLTLGDLPVGKWRYLSADEVAAVKR